MAESWDEPGGRRKLGKDRQYSMRLSVCFINDLSGIKED